MRTNMFISKKQVQNGAKSLMTKMKNAENPFCNLFHLSLLVTEHMCEGKKNNGLSSWIFLTKRLIIVFIGTLLLTNP